MFTNDDLFKIIEFLNDGTIDTSLDEKYRTISQSEKTISENYFSNILDQSTHMTGDFKRIRSLLVDWYAALRTFTTISKNVSDPYSLPSDQIDELLKSFGYNYSYNLFPASNKASFLLDLVNFYKRKGTIETLADVLDYYGFSDATLVEYWLLKDSYNNLVFRPHIARRSALGVTDDTQIIEDISYTSMTSPDAHWLYTESQILNLSESNSINLPSKSPYFALAIASSLDVLNGVMAILSKIIQDQYDRFIANLSIDTSGTDSASILKMGYTTSILSLYLAVTYAFEKIYGSTSLSSDSNSMIYNNSLSYQVTDPPLLTNIDLIVNEYLNLINTIPQTRDEVKTFYETINSDWSQDTTLHFLRGSGTAEILLQLIDPTLYNLCEAEFNAENETNLIIDLTESLDTWISAHIYSSAPSLFLTNLGFGLRQNVTNIINFFKPYRARLSAFNVVFSHKEMLRLADELPLTEITQIPEDTEILTDDFEFAIVHDDYSILNNKVDGTSFVYTEYVDSGNTKMTFQSGSFISTPSFSVTDPSFILATGQFVDFDSGGSYDEGHGSDIVEIYINS